MGIGLGSAAGFTQNGNCRIPAVTAVTCGYLRLLRLLPPPGLSQAAPGCHRLPPVTAVTTGYCGSFRCSRVYSAYRSIFGNRQQPEEGLGFSNLSGCLLLTGYHGSWGSPLTGYPLTSK